MKRVYILRSLILILFPFYLFFIGPGCKKSSTVYSPLAFSPQYDTLGGAVTFTGIAFDPSGNGDLVFFNGASDNSLPAQVITASASSLTVLVPSYALSGKVTIKVGGNSYTTQEDFLLAPTFFPLSAAVSYPVTIYGNGFSTVPSENLVRFNGTVATVQTATEHQLTVLVPQFATPGPIVVTSNRATAPSLINFTPAPTGNVTTLAGSGEAGAVDDIGAAASFNQPYGLCADSLGNIYVADFGNHKIRKITPTGTVSTFAGNGNSPDADGPLLSASIYGPASIATVNGDSNRIYVTESLGNRLRYISNDSVTTLVNSNIPANIYSQPMGLSIDTSGSLFFANSGDSNVVEITSSQQILVIAAALSPFQGYSAQNVTPLTKPTGTAVDNSGNIFISDMARNIILKITPSATLTILAGAGIPGSADGLGTAAQFNHPTSLAVDVNGNLYVVDQGNNLVRRITPDGYVTTLAGSSAQNVSTDGAGSAAGFNSPFGIAIDRNGILYISEAGGNKIRKITVR